MFNKYKKELLRSSKKLILFTSIYSIIIAISEFVCPLLVKKFIDNYDEISSKVGFILIIAAAYLICYICRAMLNLLKCNYGVNFKTKEGKRLVGYMFRMKYQALNKLEPTYLIDKILNSLETLFSLYAETVATFVIGILTMVGCIACMLFVDLKISILFLITIPIQIIGYKRLNQKLSDMCVNLQTVCAKSFANIISITSSVDFIKQCSNQDSILALITKHIHKIQNENANINRFAGIISITLGELINVTNIVIYIYTAMQMKAGRLNLSDFVFIVLILSLFFPALDKMVNANINLRDLKGVYTFIEEEIMDNLEENDGKTVDSIDSVEFHVKDVGYDKNELIKEGEFKAKKGDLIMVNGESGCGKTTLMKGLVKFLDINQILVNGMDIRKYSNKSIRSKVTFFSQNVPIISGTIRDNIIFGDSTKEDQLEKLRGKSFLKKFVESEDGLDSVVLENGSNLSGGDKQKIAIARIYFENPDVIILDEITSSIDHDTAALIINDIVENFKDKIIFMISHDNFVRKYCNKVVEINDKKISVCEGGKI